MWLEKAANLWMAALDQPAAMGKHWRITGSTTATWEGLSSYRLGGLCSGRARVVMEPTARAGLELSASRAACGSDCKPCHGCQPGRAASGRFRSVIWAVSDSEPPPSQRLEAAMQPLP